MSLSPSKLRELTSSPVGESGNRIADAIELSGLTQAAVAKALEFTPQHLNDIVRGRYDGVSLTNARKFADFFGCAIEDLFPSSEPRRKAVAR